MISFYLITTLVVLCKGQDSKPYDFSPDSRQIDINYGDQFIIQFVEIVDKTIFSHCYYQSDTISGDYAIAKVEPVQDSVYDYLPEKSCGVSVDVVDKTTPTKWQITAYDDLTKSNFTEEVTISLYDNIPLFLKDISTVNSGSYYTFAIIDGIQSSTCSLVVEDSTIELNMNSVQRYNVLGSRLHSLGGGKCGFKVINAQSEDPTEYSLIVRDNQNQAYRNNVVVYNVELNENFSNRTKEVNIGSSTYVPCGKESDSGPDTDQKYCHLYNPKGELVLVGHMCNYFVNIVTMDEVGVWKCHVGIANLMESLEFNVELKIKEKPKIETILKETDDLVIIGCQLQNLGSNVEYCKFIRPDNEVFTLRMGSATERYSSFSTDLENGICSFEVQKPLIEQEKGTWKCEIFMTLGSVTAGAFISVANTSPFNEIHMDNQINVYLDNAFTVNCLIQFPSDHCYITSPEDLTYNPTEKLQSTLGECSITIDKAVAEHNGTWTCTYARPNGVPDFKLDVEVSVVENKILYSNAEVQTGEEAILTCNTGGIPLDYCNFLSPQTVSYTLRKAEEETEKITYKGRGLEYGDCGITIRNATDKHHGLWKCYISPLGTSKYTEPMTATLMMIVNRPGSGELSSLGTSVGISFGILFILLGIGIVAIYKYTDWFRKTTQARPSNDSQENIVMNHNISGYNTNSQQC